MHYIGNQKGLNEVGEGEGRGQGNLKPSILPADSMFYNVMISFQHLRTQPSCQGMSKTRSVQDVWVPAELQWIYGRVLKGNGSLLNA